MQEELTTPKPLEAGNTSEKQDELSPVSVLFPPFEEEGVSTPECSTSSKLWTTTQGKLNFSFKRVWLLSSHSNAFIQMFAFSSGEEMSLKSNLIDKSPPIGSIARILSWDDDSCTDNISKPAMRGVHEDEDWFLFIETVLTAAGFSKGCTLSHPLDPSLREKYTNLDNNIKEFVNEGKRRQHRSTRKLIFDCINSIVSETTTTTPRMGQDSPPLELVEHVWSQVKDWLSDEYVEDIDANSVAAESLVKEEIVGRRWMHSFQAEIDDLGIGIERALLQELVEEAVLDLTQ